MKRLLELAWVYRLFRDFVRKPDFTVVYIDGHLRCRPGFRVLDLDLGCGPADILQLLPDSIEYTAST